MEVGPLRFFERARDDAAGRGLAVGAGDEHASAAELAAEVADDLRIDTFGYEPGECCAATAAERARGHGRSFPPNDSSGNAGIH